MIREIFERVTGLITSLEDLNYIYGDEAWLNFYLEKIERKPVLGARLVSGTIDSFANPNRNLSVSVNVFLGVRTELDFTPTQHDQALVSVYRSAFEMLDRLGDKEAYPELIHAGNGSINNITFNELLNESDANYTILLLSFNMKVKNPFDRC